MSVQDIKKGRDAYFAGCSKESNKYSKIDINIVEQPKDKSKPVMPKVQVLTDDFEPEYKNIPIKAITCLSEVNSAMPNEIRRGNSREKICLSPELEEQGFRVCRYASQYTTQEYTTKDGKKRTKNVDRSDRIVAIYRIIRNGKPVNLSSIEWDYLNAFGTLYHTIQGKKNPNIKWTCTLKDVKTVLGSTSGKISNKTKIMQEGAQIVRNLKDSTLQITLVYLKGKCPDDLTRKEVIDLFKLGRLEQQMLAMEWPDDKAIKHDCSEMPLLPIEFRSIGRNKDFNYILGYPAFFQLTDERGGLYCNTLIYALQAVHRFRNSDMAEAFSHATYLLRKEIFECQHRIGRYKYKSDRKIKFYLEHDPEWDYEQVRTFNKAFKSELKHLEGVEVQDGDETKIIKFITKAPDFKDGERNPVLEIIC